MIIKSGKQEGKSTQELVLKEPDWAYYFIQKVPEGIITEHIKRHIITLNKMPFVEKCQTCKKVATRMVAYHGNVDNVTFWCDACDEYSMAARRGKLRNIKKFSEAIGFVESTCNGRRSDKRLLIKRLAQAKGLPSRVDQAKANLIRVRHHDPLLSIGLLTLDNESRTNSDRRKSGVQC